MKSITFASGTLITSTAVASALLEYASQLSAANNSVIVDVPALEADGTITTHNIVLSSAIQFDVADVEVDSDAFTDESEFPVPEMPQLDDMVAVEPRATAAEDAKNFDRAIADIDSAFD
ncbi:hypothetical protein GCM10027413_30050 [Conyzicola nivalis]|uniref:Uncharacterized protein n=1 Tax=Conyzicola nivalis TaxID=1477021 RepID=A0A916SRX6_9MICO|nr:hypothetical protein [Conyzicola nivalis]GGB13142.1 hypothetical protein GCM10010979_29460 [Conyzicola nivalis]